MPETDLLEIRELTVDLMSPRGIVYALGGVNLKLGRGEIHGLVGESGCGKTMTARTILHLLDEKRSRIRGEILFEGRDLLKLSNREMASIRGKRIAMIFQDPAASLNPLFTVGEQIEETIRQHEKISAKEARKQTLSLLERVGIYPAGKRYGQYPHELSGGLQQRVMIAIAISTRPSLLIADEPTTALDVTIQAQVLSLLKDLAGELGMSVLLITHNFGIVAEICSRVSVMYAGRIVETACVKELFDRAAHPYTRALIRSIPGTGKTGEYLPTIPGIPPQLYEKEEGCAFYERCSERSERCRSKPKAIEISPGHWTECTMHQDGLCN
ncbi:MAG: ABC transporter ATP-binding protein [Blautia sp.]|nr:ABC transporter ATP-binding protein [Blautia sp.]